MRSSYFINVKRNATLRAVSAQQIHCPAVPLLLSALCMCTAGIKVAFLFSLEHPPTPFRSVGRADSDSPLTDLDLPISCNCLCILSFLWQLTLCLPHRSPHTMFEGDTPSDIHIYPGSMLGCLLTQALHNAVWTLGIQDHLCCLDVYPCYLFSCQVVTHVVWSLQAQADFYT